MKVIVYSKSACPQCVQAKSFLNRNDIAYTEVNLDNDEARMDFYETVGHGIRSVPQIFVDDVRVGGYMELMRSDILHRKAAGKFNEEF